MNDKYNSNIDKIFDEDNMDNIILTDEEGKDVEFEQVAVIPLNEQVYVILHPVTKLEGIADDEALVFLIEETEDSEQLVLENDLDIVDEVFNEYYNLLKEQGIEIE